jgi:prepilin peptidase CpaA
MIGPAVLQSVIMLFAGLLIVAMVTDIVWLRIPNWIPVGVGLLFLTAAMVEPRSLVWWGSHLAAGLVVFLVGIGLFAWGKLGGGDVKLLAAVALWFGLAPLPGLLVAIGVVGGAVSIACLVLRFYGMGRWLELLGVRALVLQSGQGAP